MSEEQEKLANEEELEQEQEEQSKKKDKESEKSKKKSGKGEELEMAQQELGEMKDKYLRLYAEFDNYKRRNAKERIELVGTATQELIVELLPVLDDFERGIQQMDSAEDIKSIKDGVKLIFHKLKHTLEQKGLTEMKSIDEEFNSELHEAITEIPAPKKEQKGKVVDEIEKGYYLHEKIIRYAKVVVGK